MVTVKTWIPKTADVGELAKMAGPVAVYAWQNQLSPPFHPTEFLLHDANKNSLLIKAAYGDVRFKFECLFVEIAHAEGAELGERKLVCQFMKWHSVRLLMGFDWDRPARLGENPPAWDQVVGENGRRINVPASAIAIGISMYGISFFNDVQDKPAAAIVADQSTPSKLSIQTDQEELRSTIASCEVIRLSDLEEWNEDVKTWLKGFTNKA